MFSEYNALEQILGNLVWPITVLFSFFFLLLQNCQSQNDM